MKDVVTKKTVTLVVIGLVIYETLEPIANTLGRVIVYVALNAMGLS